MQKTTSVSGYHAHTQYKGAEGMFHSGSNRCTVISNMAKTSHTNAKNIKPHRDNLCNPSDNYHLY
jgi:hypothetical protein